MKILIEKLYRSAEKKDGTPYISKYNKPYEKVDVISGENRYSCFDYNGQTKGWQIGQTIEVEIEENGQYKNIVLPKMGQVNPTQMNNIEARLTALEEKVFGNLSSDESGGDVDVKPKKFSTDDKMPWEEGFVA